MIQCIAVYSLQWHLCNVDGKNWLFLCLFALLGLPSLSFVLLEEPKTPKGKKVLFRFKVRDGKVRSTVPVALF